MIKILISTALVLCVFAACSASHTVWRRYQTECGANWTVTADVPKRHVQDLEDAVRFDLDVCTIDHVHYNSDLSCANLRGWEFRVLAPEQARYDADAGRSWFPLPTGGGLSPDEEAKGVNELWGYTDCAAGRTILADDVWQNGAAATEMIHVITRDCSGYRDWGARGYGCAVLRVERDFMDAGE